MKTKHEFSKYADVSFRPKKTGIDWTSVFLWCLILTIVLLFLSLGAIYGVFTYYVHDLPSIAALEDYRPKAVTKIYAADGSLITEIYEERRTPIPFKRMPPELIDAVLSIEDKHFYEHPGVYTNSIIKAFVQNLRAGKVVRGASTITQQLARTLFLSRETSYSRKIREALLALKIEHAYTKNEILEMYLNQYYFGFGYYGVEAAAKAYFDKKSEELNLAECALLAGMIKGPNIYSPMNDINLAKERRNLVLGEMYKDGKIDKKTYQAALEIPVQPVYKKGKKTFAPYFAEYVRNYLENKYGSDYLFQEGLKVYTTLDPQLQRYAEAAMESSLVKFEKDYAGRFKPTRAEYQKSYSFTTESQQATPYLQGALICIEAKTGHVKAMVGGRDFLESNFNRATQAKRQVGSAIKPIVFAAAIDNGFTPGDVMLDAPIEQTWGEEQWKPTNYDDSWHGAVTLRYALNKSINIIAIKLLGELGRSLGGDETEFMTEGAKRVIDYARRMGVTSHMNPFPSLALGSAEIPLIEITGAYSVFANNGIRIDPVFITRVVDRNGIVIERFQTQQEEVMSSPAAYLMTNMLQSVVDEGTGRGVRKQGFDRPCAGKTGTTNDYADAWFIGFTPQYITGAWVGYDELKSMGKGMVGGVIALPIWTDFMIKAHEDLPVEDFVEVTSGIVRMTICERSGLLAGPYCENVRNEIFIQGTEPIATCDLHLTPMARHDDDLYYYSPGEGKQIHNELEF